MFTVAQIGCGYWGPNLLRNFSLLAGCQVKYLVDIDPDRRKLMKNNFPSIKPVTEPEVVFGDPEVQGVVIATPAKTHFEIALTALKAGKHVFVEKPLATSVVEVDRLAKEAQARRLKIMVGHNFLYNRAVQYVKDLLNRGELGEVRYIYSQRLNLGRIRSDIDALWNFAPHDISIIQYWLGDPVPEKVTRHGVAFVQKGVDDVVFLNIKYPDGIMANIHVSWLDPQKVRKMVIVGSKKMVIYDDIAEDKIAIYDKGVDRHAVLGEHMDFDKPASKFSYRSGDILFPQIKFIEPLRMEAQHFIDCVKAGTEPMTGVSHARQVVAILEGAQGV